MSSNIKLAFYVVISSVLAFIGIQRFMSSTDYVSDSLTINSTSYMDRSEASGPSKTAPTADKKATTSNKTDSNSESDSDAKRNGPQAIRRNTAATQQNTSNRGQQQQTQLSAEQQAAQEQLQRQRDQQQEDQEKIKKELNNEKNSTDEKRNDDSSDDEEDVGLQEIAKRLELIENKKEEALAIQGSQSRQTRNSQGGQESTRSDSDADMAISSSNAGNDQENSPGTRQENNKPSIKRSESSLRARPTIKKPDAVKKKINTVRALDLAYVAPIESKCSSDPIRIGVDYRLKSYAIKGQSLSKIDKLVNQYEKCGGGTMLILQTEAGTQDTKERLIQLRKDEVKYYLLQRRIPKDNMIFSDNKPEDQSNDQPVKK